MEALTGMRVIVHDYSGHPFQIQLSRLLAADGANSVIHQYCRDHVGGKGNLAIEPGDPIGLHIEEMSVGVSFDRYRALPRFKQEIRYSFRAARAIRAHRADVVVFSNVPLLAHFLLSLMLLSVPKVFWHQDVYSAAIAEGAKARLGSLGRVLGAGAQAMEAAIAHMSKVVVPIAASFEMVYRTWRIPAEKVSVCLNWAPLAELPTRPKDNSWSQARGLVGHQVVLYAGTLGLKHDPRVLGALAIALERQLPQARLVVISEGLGRDWLETFQAERGLENLVLLDFQPYSDLPSLLGSADVLVALLEPGASAYCVPSKVLTYLCAGRPIVALVPPENLAARTVTDADAGYVVTSVEEFVECCQNLLQEDIQRTRLGGNARKFAELAFDPDHIRDTWIPILQFATKGSLMGPAAR